ncbi:MAG TPA: hypothetical protein ENJ10_00945 [Caldithrix abyssi]|uniref:FecR protein domain-containing protein n=1 Tax=Caldithrix abyssi TaxID=187145 RepID=A0A7V1LJU6_CALAY|nr:hypothetical protein [Caldithrix abyssi]
MKKISIKMLILISLMGMAFALQAKPVAIVIKAKGEVMIKNKTTGKSVKARRGLRLNDGDKISTGKKGRVAIKFIDDNSLLRIRPNSNCQISAKKEKNSVAKNIFVEFGSIFASITRQRSRFRVTTPTSVASVKGTRFWTVQEFKGKTMYFGEEGVVELANDSGVALLHSGETGIVTSKSSKPLVRKTKAGEKPDFKEDGDAPDEFEMEFEDANGNRKVLKFKVKKTE